MPNFIRREENTVSLWKCETFDISHKLVSCPTIIFEVSVQQP